MFPCIYVQSSEHISTINDGENNNDDNDDATNNNIDKATTTTTIEEEKNIENHSCSRSDHLAMESLDDHGVYLHLLGYP